MEQFSSLLSCWGRHSIDGSQMDIISHLPLELAIQILRFLGPRDLLEAMSVNRKWLHIVRSDSVLRSRVRRELRRERLAEMKRILAQFEPPVLEFVDVPRLARKDSGDFCRVLRLVERYPNLPHEIATEFFSHRMLSTDSVVSRRDGILLNAEPFGIIDDVTPRRRPTQPYSLLSSAKSKPETKAKTLNLRL